MAATPPVGTTTTSSVAPGSYSETQPRPAASETITSGSCTAGACSITVSGSTAFVTGDWVHLTAMGGTAMSDVNDVVVSAVSRTASSATVTLTLGSTTPLAATERFYLEGSQCNAVAGSWVAATASGTSITFTSLETTALSVTGASCVANFAVQVTKTGASTLTFTKVGASGTITSGTMSGTRLLPPIQGGTYSDPLGATVKLLCNGSSAQNGTGNVLRNFHSTEDPINSTNEYILFTLNTGQEIHALSDCSYVSQPKDGASTLSTTHALKWSRRAGEEKTMYFRSGAELKKIPDAILAPTTTSSVNNFNTSHACTEIGISGPTTGHEGNGVSPNGRYIAIVCKKAANEWSLISWDLQDAAVEWELDAPGDTGNIDYFHVLDDGSGGWRWSTSGDTSVSVARSGSTITFTKAGASWGPVAALQKFRVEGCSDANFNRLYTIDSTTSTTLVATDAGVTATSATGCRVVTQWRGVGYRDVDGNINPIVHLGAHGHFGLDNSGDPVWVGHLNSSGFANITTCANNVGITMRKADSSEYTDGTTYSTAMQCIWNAPYTSAGASLSVRDGWVLLNVSNTSATGPNAQEASLGASYDSNTGFGTGEAEAIIAKLVEPGASNEFYRLAKMRTLGTDFTYVAMSHDKRYVTWNSTLRYNNGSSSFQAGSQLLIDLGAWATGGISLTSVTPAEGTQNTVVGVTLAGTGMGGATPSITVSGSNVTVSNLVQVSATSWTADFTIAAGAATGSRNVTVTTADGTSNIVTFTVNAAAAPTITAMHPNVRHRGTVSAFTITGSNFDPSATVTVSGTGITTEIAFISATTIIVNFTIASNATLGSRNVSVTTDAGTSSNYTFTVLTKAVCVAGIPT